MADHNFEQSTAQLINQPGTGLGSFNLSHFNTGDPTVDPTPAPEATRCNARGTQYFGSSVWYRINPHINGRYRLVVQATSGDLIPVVAVVPVGAQLSGSCNGGGVTLRRATLPSEGFLPITGGATYFIQVGGQTVNNLPPPEESGGSDPPTEGNFDLAFTYDPNTDNDALFDSEDRCDNQPGPTNFQGCADSDGDGRADPDDRCPTARGPANFLGCPDTDRDKIPDIDDRCPRDSSSSRDPNKDGCLDLHRLVDAKLNHTFYANGVVVASLEVLHVPRRARVSIKCRRPRGRRSCGSTLIKRATAAAPGANVARTIRRLKNKRLRYGTKLVIRVTKRGATGKYIRYKVVRGKKRFKRIDRCTNVGSKKLRKRGCK